MWKHSGEKCRKLVWQTDWRTDGQTDRQTECKPIVPSGFTGGGLKRQSQTDKSIIDAPYFIFGHKNNKTQQLTTQCLVLIALIITVVIKITEPAFGDTSLVRTLPISRWVTRGAVRFIFITVIPAVILSVTSLPVRNAAIVRLTSPPACLTFPGFWWEIRAAFQLYSDGIQR